MGNRAVIVSYDTNKKNIKSKLGIYIHSYGEEYEIKQALDKAKSLHIRNVKEDPSYFWARFCQVFANILTESMISFNKSLDGIVDENQGAYDTGIGIDIASNYNYELLDCGVYYIDENFNIVKHTNGEELI